MKEQNYSNHRRAHPPYHYFTLPVVFALMVISIVYLISACRHDEVEWFDIFAVAASFFLLVIVALAREYTKKLQDRVIRMEENFRHYRLAGSPLDPALKLPQIVALRFAGDEEFLALCKRAVQENLKSTDIKKAIQKWRGDYARV